MNGQLVNMHIEEALSVLEQEQVSRLSLGVIGTQISKNHFTSRANRLGFPVVRVFKSCDKPRRCQLSPLISESHIRLEVLEFSFLQFYSSIYPLYTPVGHSPPLLNQLYQRQSSFSIPINGASTLYPALHLHPRRPVSPSTTRSASQNPN